MATLISKIVTDGAFSGSNYTTAITTTNALQTAGLTNQAVTTTPTGHLTFVGSNETVTAVGLELGAVGVLTGVTFTIRLVNSTDAITVGTYTYDATLLTTGGRGWHFFSFGSGVVLTAGKNWQVQVSANISSRITLLRNTTSDWNRIFVTDVSAAPATNDAVYFAGRINTDGTLTPTSLYYDASITLQNFYINNGATITWTTDGLALTLTGGFKVNPGSTFQVGTPSVGVTGSIQFSNASFGANPFTAYGPCNLNIYGSDISSNYNIPLASTANSGQALAVVSSAPDAGWAPGASVVYTGSRTHGGCEIRTISSVSGTTIIAVGNFTKIHDVRTVGTNVVINDTAKACLIDRGFIVKNASGATGSWYGSMQGVITSNLKNVCFRDQGANVAASGNTPSKYGMIVEITDGGTFIVDNCSFLTNTTQAGLHALGTENSNTRLCTDYNISNSLFVLGFINNTAYGILSNNQAGKTTTLTNCIFTCQATNILYPVAHYVRQYHAGNISISNCEYYGFLYTYQFSLLTSTGAPVGNVTIDNSKFIACITPFYMQYFYSQSFSSIGNIRVTNCEFTNRVYPGNVWQLIGNQVYNCLIYMDNCKMVGFVRFLASQVNYLREAFFTNCQYEEDGSQTSLGPIRLQASSPNNYYNFYNCAFYSTYPSIVSLDWSNLPFYSKGQLNFKNCYFNKTRANFTDATSQKYFGDIVCDLDNCTFTDTSYTGVFSRMGDAYFTNDTFTGSGSAVALRPIAGNEASAPFSFSFLLPTNNQALTVTFKTKSYSLNAPLSARIIDKYQTLHEQVVNISSGWDSQTITKTVSGYNQALTLQFVTSATSGYVVIDNISVPNTNTLLLAETQGLYLTSTGGGGGGGETSFTFC